MAKRRVRGMKGSTKSLAHNSCPAGHGAMYWMAEPELYFCSHQQHDMTGEQQWFTADELADKHSKMKEANA